MGRKGDIPKYRSPQINIPNRIDVNVPTGMNFDAGGQAIAKGMEDVAKAYMKIKSHTDTLSDQNNLNKFEIGFNKEFSDFIAEVEKNPDITGDQYVQVVNQYVEERIRFWGENTDLRTPEGKAAFGNIVTRFQKNTYGQILKTGQKREIRKLRTGMLEVVSAQTDVALQQETYEGAKLIMDQRLETLRKGLTDGTIHSGDELVNLDRSGRHTVEMHYAKDMARSDGNDFMLLADDDKAFFKEFPHLSQDDKDKIIKEDNDLQFKEEKETRTRLGWQRTDNYNTLAEKALDPKGPPLTLEEISETDLSAGHRVALKNYVINRNTTGNTKRHDHYLLGIQTGQYRGDTSKKAILSDPDMSDKQKASLIGKLTSIPLKDPKYKNATSLIKEFHGGKKMLGEYVFGEGARLENLRLDLDELYNRSVDSDEAPQTVAQEIVGKRKKIREEERKELDKANVEGKIKYEEELNGPLTPLQKKIMRKAYQAGESNVQRPKRVWSAEEIARTPTGPEGDVAF